ncbi:LysM domain protein, partial [Metarhizium majus ARSEF 297]
MAATVVLGWVLLLGLGHASVLAHSKHEHDAHSHLHQNLDRSSSPAGNSSSEGAAELVKHALATAALRNKARVENPMFNKPELDPKAKQPSLAPPLTYLGGNRTQVDKRDGIEANSTSAGYSIPRELAEAAKFVAESSPQVPTGDHEEVANRLRHKYKLKVNDTNAPTRLQTPEGLLSQWGPDMAADDASDLHRRDSGYWMLDMPQLGSSPFGPQGYKVWRNVKDYGAKGDGKTDDTAAINLAISDGGRCGPNCGSSTVHPAVVFFPPGTYLISSSIIQYYNTQLLGDPNNVPTILGASSFLGLGMITSDVYVSDREQWYLNTNNFLRSIRNFIIDVRNTDPRAYVCGIHWQVAQGTSIESVTFYMKYNSDDPGNTQQGIYMGNGSGGFLADLTFIGGNFGAYMGNQQFTTSHLVFHGCKTAVQIHWDWAWTMHDFVIDGCQTGLRITGGAGGLHSTGQGVGSLVLVDSTISNTPNGIETSLVSESSTSFLLQNVGFFNVETAVQDDEKGSTLLAGGSQVVVDSWGFGRVNNAAGPSEFVAGGPVPVMDRPEALVGDRRDGRMQPNLLTRRRPLYYNVAASNVIDVKALGAKGDGATDDTAVLNAILEGAANTSSVVYFPFGVYIITDTLHVPVGSRIIGQAWSQIMARGHKFLHERKPRAAVQFGREGDVGILEVQDMMFTVTGQDGATPGAVLVEWNVQQSFKGAAGMWDSHIRVGGAEGTWLQRDDCPKNTGQVNPYCRAAALLMHLTPGSSAYLENVWLWTADHDLDKVTQDQIDVYAGRGMLIESDTAWLWGTAVEHCVLYQYQISSASTILMSMIQTESPYFQPIPKAPFPFNAGVFPNDPTFADCSSLGCYSSWAVRIVDSTAVYILGAGLYSWFSDYKQDCLGTEDCQQAGFEVVQSYDIWVYNLCTKAIVEMVSPWLTAATMAKDNKNGFLSSVVAWLQGSKEVSGRRQFTGFQVYTPEDVDALDAPVSSSCRTALTRLIECDDAVEKFARLELRTSVGDSAAADSVCDAGCGASLQSWFAGVANACLDYTTNEGASLTIEGGRMYAGYNETCLKNAASADYCVDIVSDFEVVSSIENMSDNDICSYCFTSLRSMMQQSRYSNYDAAYERDLSYINSRCNTGFNTTIPLSLVPEEPQPPCDKDRVYITKDGDTCDSIALEHSLSSAAIYIGNPFSTPDCRSFEPGTELCLPPSCAHTYLLEKDEWCSDITAAHEKTLNITFGDIEKWNPWIEPFCGNMWNSAENAYGHVICLSPQNGEHSLPGIAPDFEVGTRSNGYAKDMVQVPQHVTIAEGSAKRCGIWHTAEAQDTCLLMTFKGPTTIDILMTVNPSLGSDPSKCSDRLVPGLAYCVFPMHNWNLVVDDDGKPVLPASTQTTTSAVPSSTHAFTLKSFYHPDCTGDVHDDVSMPLDSWGICINTECKVASLDIAAEGLCPNGHVQLSYWEKEGCVGQWFGYGYTSRGVCRTLWTEGWKFKAINLRCMPEKDDCVSLGTCTDHDSSGGIFSYFKLESLSRPVYAIYNPWFKNTEKWSGGTRLFGEKYIQLIKTVVSKGDILVGGEPRSRRSRPWTLPSGREGRDLALYIVG